jgi:hypothetical protein
VNPRYQKVSIEELHRRVKSGLKFFFEERKTNPGLTFTQTNLFKTSKELENAVHALESTHWYFGSRANTKLRNFFHYLLEEHAEILRENCTAEELAEIEKTSKLKK